MLSGDAKTVVDQVVDELKRLPARTVA